MSKTAIIIGATGLTGRFVLDKLLEDERYSTIKIFSRKSMNIRNSKIIEKIGNLLQLDDFKDDFIADELYCCIGTTAKKTPDKFIYKKIDYGIPVSSAKLCKSNGISTILIVSALGANTKSSIFYSKTKGEMERDVAKENIRYTYFLRPSIIVGNRTEKRLGETIGIAMFNFFQFLLIGKLKKYRAIHAEKIAEKMIQLANTKPGIQIINSDEIQKV